MSNEKYTREALLRSERFAGVQPDFLAAILVKPEYTISEAEKAIKNYFEKERED